MGLGNSGMGLGLSLLFSEEPMAALPEVRRRGRGSVVVMVLLPKIMLVLNS
jgi:hypothetical protein